MAGQSRRVQSRRMAPAALLLILPLIAACGHAQGATPPPSPSVVAALNVSTVSTAVPFFTAPTSAAPQPARQSTAPTHAAPPAAGESAATTLVAGAQPAAVTTADHSAERMPVHVAIARAGVDAAIVPLGETSGGAMATPETPTAVGWWQFGAAPGERGSAVLGGHLDFHDYGAAVFWNLNKLRPGDSVQVTRADGTQLRFVVQSSEVYPEADTAVIDRIFRQNDAAHLNLITCAGTFNPVTRDYDKRLVVYTTLAQ
jgi:hypothetical protein